MGQCMIIILGNYIDTARHNYIQLVQRWKLRGLSSTRDAVTTAARITGAWGSIRRGVIGLQRGCVAIVGSMSARVKSVIGICARRGSRRNDRKAIGPSPSACIAPFTYVVPRILSENSTLY